MNFGFSEDQQTIKATARELLAERSPMARVREAAESGAADDRLWRELFDLGWPGIAVAVNLGGIANITDLPPDGGSDQRIIHASTTSSRSTSPRPSSSPTWAATSMTWA